MSDISDFRWWTSISTKQCVTCLNLKYPLMLLQVARSMFLEMLREPLAMAINHSREMSLSCVVPTVQGDPRQELGRAGKDHHVLPPTVINAEKTNSECKKVEILDWSFFFPDGLMMRSVEGQIRGGRRNSVQISMYEQRAQTEQAKHRLCTLLHLMGHKRHRHRDLAKGCVNTKIREGSSGPSMTLVSIQSETDLTDAICLRVDSQHIGHFATMKSAPPHAKVKASNQLATSW